MNFLDWTEDETLLLLEGIEKFGSDSWERVSKHVGTKSVQQCILHFIRLPIDDQFLEHNITQLPRHHSQQNKIDTKNLTLTQPGKTHE